MLLVANTCVNLGSSLGLAEGLRRRARSGKSKEKGEEEVGRVYDWLRRARRWAVISDAAYKTLD